MFDEKPQPLQLKEIPIYAGYPSDITLDTPDALARLPLLTKADLNGKFPMIWMTQTLKDAIAADMVEYASTSGTSGDRLQIVRDRDWWQSEYRRTYAMHPKLAQVDLGSTRKAILTTSVCSSAVCWRDNPTYDQRLVGTTLYLNTAPNPNRWSAGETARIISEIDRWKPEYIDMHGEYGAILARKAAVYGIDPPAHRPKVITVSYDFTSSSARRHVEAFFGARPYDLFGATEFGYAFVQTDDGFNQISSNSLIELLPLDGRDDLRRLVITTTKNRHMPLVRYETGDLFAVSPQAPDRPTAIAGRRKDCALSDTGTPITALDVDRALEATGMAPVQFQLLWNDADIRLHVVESEQDPSVWKAALATLMGGKRPVTIARVSEIAPEASGKFSPIKTI
jgi:phenylacetate-CoA ligase